LVVGVNFPVTAPIGDEILGCHELSLSGSPQESVKALILTGFSEIRHCGWTVEVTDNDFTKILQWPGYRVYRHAINESGKRLRLGPPETGKPEVGVFGLWPEVRE
jgi:hypothetical protein